MIAMFFALLILFGTVIPGILALIALSIIAPYTIPFTGGAIWLLVRGGKKIWRDITTAGPEIEAVCAEGDRMKAEGCSVQDILDVNFRKAAEIYKREGFRPKAGECEATDRILMFMDEDLPTALSG